MSFSFYFSNYVLASTSHMKCEKIFSNTNHEFKIQRNKMDNDLKYINIKGTYVENKTSDNYMQQHRKYPKLKVKK